MPFLIAFLLGLAATPLARRVGLAVGAVDRPTDDRLKIHREPIPLLGGLAAVGAAFAAQALGGGGLPWPVLAASGLALAVGFLDDLRSLSPLGRIILIAGAAAVLVIGGTGLERIGPGGGAGLILLVLACSNAVNITDGQDGLAGGVAAISSLSLAGILSLSGDDVGSSLGVALAGGLLAFLVWNRPPARIFLGDGGAYAVGTVLAVLAARVIALEGLRGLLAAGAALGVLAFEVGFSVGRRVAAGQHLSGGDRLHSYDLVARRLGRTRSTLVFWGLAVLSGAAALVVSLVPVVTGAFLFAVGVLLAAWWAVWLWRHRPTPSYQRGTATADPGGEGPVRTRPARREGPAGGYRPSGRVP